MIPLDNFTRIMAEQLLHDVLGDAAVDEPGPESVAEAVGGDGDRLAGLVAQVDDASATCASCRLSVAVRVGLGAVGVVDDPGEQPRAARRPVLAGRDLAGRGSLRRPWRSSGMSCSARTLMAVEAQARPADAVVEHRAELERAGVTDPQTGLDQHHDEVARRRGGQLVESGVGLELGHRRTRG